MPPFFDKGLRCALKEKFMEDILKPFGLEIYGNKALLDDCPFDFFLGILFLLLKGRLPRLHVLDRHCKRGNQNARNIWFFFEA